MHSAIFVSYAHPNLDQVRSLVSFLRSNHFDVWFDKDSLLAGDEWDAVIVREIKNARVFLLCLSSEAVDRRGYFHKEIRVALDVAKSIPPNSLYMLPVRLNECSIPDSISQWHVQDIFGEEWESRLLQALRRAFPETESENPTITINTRPITGVQGQVITISYDPNMTIYSLLTQIYYGMEAKVEAYSYGKQWIIRNDDTGELYDAENDRKRKALQLTSLDTIGLKPNMNLSTVYKGNYKFSKSHLPNKS